METKARLIVKKLELMEQLQVQPGLVTVCRLFLITDCCTLCPPGELGSGSGYWNTSKTPYKKPALPLPMLAIKSCVFYAWPPQADHSRFLWNLLESGCSHLEHRTSTGSKGGTIWPYVTTHFILLSKATTAPFPCTYSSKLRIVLKV